MNFINVIIFHYNHINYFLLLYSKYKTALNFKFSFLLFVKNVSTVSLRKLITLFEPVFKSVV